MSAGKLSWRPVPFACSKKHRAPKTVKETPLASVPAQALSLDGPDPLCLLESAGVAVPPVATRGASVSSPMKAVAESTTSSPGCTKRNPGLDVVGSMECEPSSTVPDPIVGKAGGASESPLPPHPIVDLTADDSLDAERPSSCDRPGPSVAAGVSTAALSEGSLTPLARTIRDSVIINLDKNSDASNEGSVGDAQEDPVKDDGVETLASGTGSAATTTGNVVRMEVVSPDGLHPSHMQTDTKEAQGAESGMATKVNVQGAESERPAIVNVLRAEPGVSPKNNVQGAETEGMQEVRGSECLMSEHVQKVQEFEPNCRDTELDQEAESEDQQVEHVQDIISECAATEHVQEMMTSECTATEHVQEVVSGCATSEHVQMISDCAATEQHVQEVVSKCATTEHVQEAEPNYVTTKHVQETEPTCVSTEHVREVVSECIITEHVQTDVSAHPEKDESPAAPSGLSKPPSSPQTPCQVRVRVCVLMRVC